MTDENISLINQKNSTQSDLLLNLYEKFWSFLKFLSNSKLIWDYSLDSRSTIVKVYKICNTPCINKCYKIS